MKIPSLIILTLIAAASAMRASCPQPPGPSSPCDCWEFVSNTGYAQSTGYTTSAGGHCYGVAGAHTGGGEYAYCAKTLSAVWQCSNNSQVKVTTDTTIDCGPCPTSICG